ncbi:MAG: LiaF-related protein, partial [Clostridia bacterium]
TFGGNTIRVPQDFVSGEAIAVFGGVEVDFRDFVANSDIYLKADATFGGVDIYIPHNVKVIVSSNNVFGGTDDHTNHANDDSFEYTMYIQSNAVFGGVDIK